MSWCAEVWACLRQASLNHCCHPPTQHLLINSCHLHCASSHAPFVVSYPIAPCLALALAHAHAHAHALALAVALALALAHDFALALSHAHARAHADLHLCRLWHWSRNWQG